ncbi:MAG: hypothetical protein WA672_19400 [Candidatus Angelobacter sp.]
MTRRERIDHTLTLLNGMIIGAMLLYVFDEHRGARRRAYARDKLIRTGHLLSRMIRKRSLDLMHRTVGSLAEVRSSIRDRGAEIPDDILVDRVRSQLGHVVSHPGLLEVSAHDGCVSVKGPVLRSEVNKIQNRMAKIRGVRDCRLDLQPEADLDQVAGSRGTRQIQEAL